MSRARILATAAAFAFGLFIGWYGGIDYMTRSFPAALSIVGTSAFAFWIWIWPGWSK